MHFLLLNYSSENLFNWFYNTVERYVTDSFSTHHEKDIEQILMKSSNVDSLKIWVIQGLFNRIWKIWEEGWIWNFNSNPLGKRSFLMSYDHVIYHRPTKTFALTYIVNVNHTITNNSSVLPDLEGQYFRKRINLFKL